MKTKQILAGLVGAAVLCSMGITASAAEVPNLDAPAVGQNTASAPARILAWGTIKEIRMENGLPVQVAVSRTEENGGELVLNVNTETIVLDSQTGVPAYLCIPQPGDDNVPAAAELCRGHCDQCATGRSLCNAAYRGTCRDC